MKVVFALESETDLDEIASEIGKDNPRAAVSYIQDIRDACMALTDYPRRYPVVARLGDEYRRFVHGPYSIFYLINDDHVRIVRIVHGARLITVDMFL